MFFYIPSKKHISLKKSKLSLKKIVTFFKFCDTLNRNKQNMVEKKNDEQLMTEVKLGNLDSLSPLFEKHHVKLYNFFVGMTRDRDISEDLTQNVFRRILTYRESYNENWQFRTWMYQIARNVCANHYNNQKLLITDFEDVEAIAHVNNFADEELENENKKRILHEALSKLTIEQREIIELSRFQKMKYKEIATITGNSIPAIKVKVHRAINKLRDYYFELA